MARRCTAGSDISPVSLVVRRGTRSWDPEIRYDAEVVARPHALYRLVEDALAGDDGERGTMVAASKGLPIRSDASRWKSTRTLTEGRRARNLS
jgi:pSer/pThr/pTyr-binding forkhead associated (FHA) protein